MAFARCGTTSTASGVWTPSRKSTFWAVAEARLMCLCGLASAVMSAMDNFAYTLNYTVEL